MSEAANAPEGQLIEGRYRIVRRIAQGGMATVYEARDERLARTVAIKVMHTQLAQGPHRDQFIERFRREARSAAQIANPHIVQVYDTGEFNGLAYLVMEYVHGVNLRHEMNLQGTFTVRETLRIVAETLDGLASAHRVNVVHRDIKPENIMLNDRGRVQITDFGLAKATSQATLSSTGMLLGTAAYLPPETIERNDATPQGDLYAVGIMAWEMLAGEVPFISDNPVTLVFKHVHEDVPSVSVPCPGIDPSVARFIAHLTARSIEERPSNAAAALDELRRIGGTLSADAWAYRRPAAAAADVHPAPEGPMLAGMEDTGTGVAEGAAASEDATGMTDSTGSDIDASTLRSHRLPLIPPAPATANPPHTSISSPMPPRPAVPADAASDASDANGDNAQPTMTMGAAATRMLPPMADTGATRTMPAMGDESESAVPTPSTEAPAKQDKRRKGPRKAILITIAVLLVLALAGGGTGAWWYYLGPGSYWALPKPADVSCTEGQACRIAGAKWQSYESLLKVAGIPYTTAEDYSDTVAQGAIISAKLAGSDATVDAHVSKRHTQTLDVVISKGVKMATIPSDILDPNSANGKAPLDALKNAGLTNVRHDESKDAYSETLPEGVTLSISPDPGTTIKHNDEVTVTLSKGPMPVQMPDIVGRSKDEAAQALGDLKLKANYSEQYSDTVEAGKIISASVAKGTQLHWGDSVDVVVSKGPQMVTIPDVRGQAYDDAAKTLQALGLDVQKTAPLGDLTHTVRLQDPNPGQQVRVRDTNGKKTVVTLTVV
ncbi:serine/threonine protein kinase [Bifidobacterium callitrichos]|uniref:non-specific serine/threonine protein kinase n=1 Tax=Bifidobacterium callitrichos TaxID=762209 RepID=A0A2T3GCC9_9BIFI|nr:PASTA domain-containing protein [Bifidobacterium callitrichos]PST47138.1 serine/threonine protein kinase [Bifidobacterium callitrichos]